MLVRLYMYEFVDLKIESKHKISQKISYKGNKFKKLMDSETIKVRKHYQMSLPFSHTGVCLPIYRKLAEKILLNLKKEC